MKINRIKRLFTLVMIVLIIMGMTIPASLAANPNGLATTTISNADELQTYFKNPDGKVGILMNDITAPKGKAFVLPKGHAATLDLHGKTITGAEAVCIVLRVASDRKSQLLSTIITQLMVRRQHLTTLAAANTIPRKRK